jgi:hypothetical protein
MRYYLRSRIQAATAGSVRSFRSAEIAIVSGGRATMTRPLVVDCGGENAASSAAWASSPTSTRPARLL